MIQSMCRGGVRCTVSSSSEDQRIRGSKQGQRVRGADEVQMAEVQSSCKGLLVEMLVQVIVQVQRGKRQKRCSGDAEVMQNRAVQMQRRCSTVVQRIRGSEG